MAEKEDWVSILRGIIQQMAYANVTELEVRNENLRIRLRRDTQTSNASSPKAGVDEPTDRGHAGLHRVSAPLTGIFYTAPNPASKPYVATGDWVEHDTVVGLIETMKVFNQVTAECRGRVVAIPVQQGQLVRSGEPILLVDTSAAPDRIGEVVS